MQIYYVTITDTFAGEANFSWVTRYKVTAASVRGAMRKIGRISGLKWRKVGDYGDEERWDSASGATCAFVELWDDDAHSALNVIEL